MNNATPGDHRDIVRFALGDDAAPSRHHVNARFVLGDDAPADADAMARRPQEPSNELDEPGRRGEQMMREYEQLPSERRPHLRLLPANAAQRFADPDSLGG